MMSWMMFYIVKHWEEQRNSME